jgi:hypothetical protein
LVRLLGASHTLLIIKTISHPGCAESGHIPREDIPSNLEPSAGLGHSGPQLNENKLTFCDVTAFPRFQIHRVCVQAASHFKPITYVHNSTSNIHNSNSDSTSSYVSKTQKFTKKPIKVTIYQETDKSFSYDGRWQSNTNWWSNRDNVRQSLL